MRNHVSGAILEAAAEVFAERGESAGMAEVAAAAGVGRATLYRYFPSREALVAGLFDAALTEIDQRLTDARLPEAGVAEAVARATRAVLTATARWRGLGAIAKDPQLGRRAEELMVTPLRELIGRGVADGTFRTDLAVESIVEVYLGMLEGSVTRVVSGRMGVETAAAALTAIFLTGAAARP